MLQEEARRCCILAFGNPFGPVLISLPGRLLQLHSCVLGSHPTAKELPASPPNTHTPRPLSRKQLPVSPSGRAGERVAHVGYTRPVDSADALASRRGVVSGSAARSPMRTEHGIAPGRSARASSIVGGASGPAGMNVHTVRPPGLREAGRSISMETLSVQDNVQAVSVQTSFIAIQPCDPAASSLRRQLDFLATSVQVRRRSQQPGMRLLTCY